MSSAKKIKPTITEVDDELDQRIVAHNNRIQKLFFLDSTEYLSKLFENRYDFEQTSNISCAIVTFLSKSTNTKDSVSSDVPIEGAQEFLGIVAFISVNLMIFISGIVLLVPSIISNQWVLIGIEFIIGYYFMTKK